ncbi:MAG: hypothetical protein AUG10_04095 [Gemmatimonadetes bacterium 13_1_20CM_2_70_10]|nr:MAG: hypothetical protein AUG10_04095 [Gemmatimonadetes bacterium 13_1_20CM_2_70_10]
MTTQTTNCPRCGQPISAGARFCASCGSDLSGQQNGLATAKLEAPRLTQSDSAVLEQLRQATLGEYEVMGLLGRGGMATVYLAHDVALDRKVAIKVMSPHLISGEGMAERFKREARTAGSLSHPHIIPIYAVKEAGDLLYFVMKFVEGRPLDGIIREVGPLPLQMVQPIMQQVGSALGYAHRRGIIHRDIKPPNVMLDVEGWAVVTDFGIAKVSDKRALTMTGATVGTPSYMSPEQCGATKELGPASDQYSLGIVAYEMLSGRLPFVAESVMAIMYAHFNEPPPPIQNVRADCPPEIAAAVMRMLEKEPENRWPNVEAAVAAFGAAPLHPDDPVRTKMITLATQGGTSQLAARLSTPASPTPMGRGQPGRPAQRTGTAQKSGTAVTGLTLSPAQVSVAVGGAVQLTARPKGTKGGTLVGHAIRWASTDTDVATVTEDGLVTAIRPGAATITCTCEGASATALVTVTAHAKSRALLWTGSVVGAAALALGVWQLGPWHRKAAGPPPTQGQHADSTATGRTQREERRQGLAAMRNDSVLRDLRANVRAARERAVSAGATPADLSPGDAERRVAEDLAVQGRLADAIGHLTQAMTLWGTAEQTARARAQQAAAPPAAAPPPVTAAPTPAAPENPRPLIEAAIQNYARALESRDIAQVRRAYPGLTSQQAAVLQDFFSRATNLKVNIGISQLQVNGDIAEAQVEGTTQFVQGRQRERQPNNFQATLERSGAAWRLATIR